MPMDSERQAGTELRDIEITPEMIEAGADALLNWLGDDKARNNVPSQR